MTLRFVRQRLADEHLPQSPRKWEFDVAGHIVLSRAGAAADGGPRPAFSQPGLVTTMPREPASTGPARFSQRIWWLGWLTLLAACLGSTWLVATWLNGWLRRRRISRTSPTSKSCA
ncbi:MAG: hypothetical protein ACR2GT_13440 [Gaiellaceae bacterium]